MMKLKKLHKYKKMKIEDCIEAFSGVFGFNQSTLDSGNFPGTMFRFPLRKEATELSDNIYDKSKVDDLFMSFRDEASVSLLFLKCLESITLLREEDLSKKDDIGEFYFSVYIDETTVENVRSARDDLKSKIKDVQNNLPSCSIENSYFMTICVKDNDYNITTRKWKVRNLFQGDNSMSSTLRNLSCDESLSYSPYVGVAMEMTCPVNFQGHVFCFLPLPSREKSLSGLPIHVNGCFALSQNRCVVKWPTADQIRNHAHTDKSIQWNQVLVKEVLSEVYCQFLRELIEESCLEKGGLNEHRTTVYHCIPNKNLVDEHWKILIPPLVAKLKEVPIFFTPNEGGKWIPQSQAIFFRPGKDADPTIRKILEMYNQNTVDVEDYIWETMELQECQEVTPNFINKMLRSSDKYMACSTEDKFSLLRYLLSSNQCNILEGLCLLPLRNGSFIKFNRGNSSPKIFKTSLSKMQLLVGMEDQLLQDFPTDIDELFSAVIDKGRYQVKFLDDRDFIELLKKAIGKNIGEGHCPVTWDLTKCSVNFNWLEMVWEFLAEKFPKDLGRFQYLPLIPEDWSGNEIVMHALTENLLVGSLKENISICLKRLSIEVLRELPEIIMHHPQLKLFVHEATVKNTVNAINVVGNMSNWEEKVAEFNNHSSKEEKEAFLGFLCSERQNLENCKKDVYKSLKLFQMEGEFVDLMENRQILSKDIPVPYPLGVIHTSNENIIHFATQLGASELNDVKIFTDILMSLLNSNYYNKMQMMEIMDFVIDQKIYTLSDQLRELVCKVPFVTTVRNMQKTAADLFDPEEKILWKIISDLSQFPTQNLSPKRIKVLRKFGLKSPKNLTATDIYTAALEVHKGSMENNVTAEIKEKQSAIFTLLSERGELFDQYVENEGCPLRTLLMDLEIVEPMNNPTSCIPNMQWFKYSHDFCEPSRMYNHEYEIFIGYVAPVISVSTPVSLVAGFGWNRAPDVELILKQHSLYVDKYQEEYKSEYLLPIKQLYQYLSKMFPLQSRCNIELDKMWMGDGFVLPSQIYINSDPDDIDTKPYLLPLPKELQTNDIKELASQIGCKEKQTAETLVAVLHLLNKKHEQSDSEKNSNLLDLDIIIRILNKLKNVSDVKTMNVPIPIHTANKSKLEFRAASECNYCNAEWLKELAEEDGESMFFVHEDVSSDTAAKLGVPSLTDNLLSETEGIQEWGQREPLTRRIKSLLKDYKDGFVVPKELVQNADDARATKVCFLYDQRENTDCQTKLIDEEMKKCQGPALWAFNDALFTQKDLENITKLSAATKADDLTKIGKFGLGFCSVYNLTDVPSFITGSNMVIFDPHTRYIGKALKEKNPGLKIDLTATKNRVLLRRMKNQFKPFNGIFGCNLNTEDPSFNGTLFRFPFRTTEQLFGNEISEKAYDEHEIKSMISLFLENAGNLLLFTQHVEEIEFYHLSKESDPTNPVLLHRVSRKMSTKNSDILSIFGTSMKSYQLNPRTNPQEVLQTSFLTIITEVTQDCHPFHKSEKGKSETKWFISWASGTSESLEMGKRMVYSGALPLASTAVYLKEEDKTLQCSSLRNTPEGFYKIGHIFCYLPLPVNSPLPLHINGSFAVSSNRRQLSSKTSDDKSDTEYDWNEALVSDALVNAYINLIENLDRNGIMCENYHELWPVVTLVEENSLFNAFYETFYRSIIQRDSRVFSGKQKWLPLSRCLFLDPELQRSKIGEIATEATRKYKEDQQFCLVSLDQINDSYLKLFGKLPDQIQSRIISLECFYSEIFLENIDDEYWSLDSIKALVGFALDKQMESIHSKMQSIKCIPAAPNGKLKMPNELVNPNGKVANLFCEEDERFPVKEFHSIQRLSVLKFMGMMTDVISDDLLIERITSVENDAKICSKCGIKKCKNILLYIQETKPLNNDVIIRIKDIAFLPTLLKPDDWFLPWFLDKKDLDVFASTCSNCNRTISFILSKPTDLYMDNCRNLVGCRELVIDLSTFQISLYHRNVLDEIGVRFVENVTVVTVVEQLKEICQNVNPSELPDIPKQLLGTVCTDMYRYLDNASKNGSIPEIESLKQFPCLLIDDTFVMPNQTAMSISVQCSPTLYGLDRIQWKIYKVFLQMIGVKESFQVEDVILVLEEMSKKGKGMLDDKSLDLACKLVELLASVHKSHIPLEKYKYVCIPDQSGALTPIHNLCLDDSTRLQMGDSLKFIHPKIKEADAQTLGVQTKLSGSLMQNYVRQMRPFGQKEELSDRIKRILKQYPFNESVLTEMLQNADDAKATEIMFITDFEAHGTEKTFESKWHPVQGPALLVYNNSYFTDEDIAGVQHLGRGSKGDDPTKTGQYGVGFNAVYHITDVPSFLSKSPDREKDTLCVMDPNCKYAPGANEKSPGVRFVKLDELRESFSDVFTCYHENLLLQSSGTVFRLPLRTKHFAENSELSQEEVTEIIINDMLQNFETVMTKSLLFLRNVRKISTGSIKNGKLVEEHWAKIEISEEHLKNKSDFDKYVADKAMEFQQKRELFNRGQHEVSYEVTLKGNTCEDTKWCIIQTFGFENDTEIPDSVEDAFDDDRLGLLPQGGVALHLHHSALNDATAFCFMPLPCQTGLTVHINGHFSLDNESRRGLWKDDKKAYRTEWNNLLLSHVIAPTYAKALEWLQHNYGLNPSVRGVQSEMQTKLRQFYSYFPNIEKAEDHYWKCLVRSVYQFIEKKNMKLFLSCREVDNDEIELSCYSLHEENGNTLFKMENEDEEMIKLSKDLGAKLVDTPLWICESIEKTEINIDKFNPKNLSNFLKSSNCETSRLMKKQKHFALKSSALKTPENVKKCLEFCMRFKDDIEGIPLCLLETENLVEFSCQSPILLTKFSALIPSSNSELLHHELHDFFRDKDFQCVEQLTLERFASLLPSDLDYDSYRHKICPWIPNQDSLPNKIWLEDLWRFLGHEIETINEKTEMMRILHPILPWSIIPTTRVQGLSFHGLVNNVTNELYPLENGNSVIDLTNFQLPLKSALTKLRLPVLENDHLPTGHPLCHFVATQNRMHDVLECIYVHKKSIEDNDQLTTGDSDTILEFFAGGLKELLEMPNSQQLLTMLRKLPLFTTVYDQMITLEESRDILSLPEGLPSDGMDTWAAESRKILLKRNSKLKIIFEHFNVTEHSICDVYVVHILPYFQNIPEENRIKHLEYIRDDLLRKSGKYNGEQNRLINALKELQFIPHCDGSYKLPSYYFSPFSELMTIMCDDPSRFPPVPFNSKDWKMFMTLLGMKTKTTPDLILEFALQLESQGRHGLPKNIEEKSKCLVRHLYKLSNYPAEFLKHVSRIKFIVPHQIDPFYFNICPPPMDSSNHLIPFDESVTNTFMVTTWTHHRILPFWIDWYESKIRLSELGVHEPKSETIFTHIRTVCGRLGDLSDKELHALGLHKISRLMRSFYEYANDEEKVSSMDIQTFRKISFVFMSNVPGLFPCDRFTLQLEEKYEIKPYLMEIPVEYYGYFELFEKLGASKKISSTTFAKILQEIHSIGDTLHANELQIARKAMKFFFELLPAANVSHIENQDLYLLSRDCKLMNSKDLVFVDLPFVDKSIKNAEQHLCVMSDIDEIDIFSMEKHLKSLPEKIRPRFLSEVIESKYDIENAKISENIICSEIDSFLRCKEFINGVVRLFYEEKITAVKKEYPSHEIVSTIAENMHAVSIKSASGMQKISIFQGREVARSPCKCYIDSKQENGKKVTKVFLDFGEENNAEMIVRKNLDFISRAIIECTGCRFHNTSTLLSMICSQIKSPNEIESFLDDRMIQSLDKRHRKAYLLFPKPGNVVEIRWHCILDNNVISFEPGEYVAYISGINTRGDVEYKYAIIKKRLHSGANANVPSLSQAYLVEIRPDELKEMKVFELYKFNRSKDPVEENVYRNFQVEILHQQDGAEANINTQDHDDRTLEEIFQEIREKLKYAFTLPDKEKLSICRGIMKKWHPDKHPNDVTRATQIFQYTREIIEKLKAVDEDIIDEFEKYFKREKENYWRIPCTPRDQSPEDTYHPNPQPFTASTWLDESIYDMRYAKQSEDTMDDENEFCSWMCQICHQAAEKALVAWQYMDDARRVRRSENLANLPQSLPRELRRLATDLEILTQGVMKMKYPDGTYIPSRAYTRDQANQAMELANEIIEKVDEYLR
ncbi:sacsin-like isoform X2 [Crassostrea virginica]